MKDSIRAVSLFSIRAFALLLIGLLILFFTGIGLASPQPDSSSLRWPAPPEKARIRHIITISSLQSLSTEKSFISKVFGFLFGGNQSSRWLVQPVGIAISDTKKLYISDPGAKGIHIIDQVKNTYEFIAGTRFGNFKSPVGMAFAPDGTLFVSDSEEGEVVALDEDHDQKFVIKDHLNRPTGLQIIGGKLYVIDTGLHKVVVFDLAGNYLTEFGRRGAGAGEFNFPVQIAGKDTIDVVDALNYRIQRFTQQGDFVSTFGALGNVPGRFASPKGVALDSDGDIYVSDALLDNIQIFNQVGQLLLVVGRKGNGDGEFMSPNGIVIDRDDNIYVVDSLNKRIQIFQYLK